MHDRITVLAVIKGLGRGGAEQLVLEQARLTTTDSFDLHVAYTLPEKGDLVPALQAAGATVHEAFGHAGTWPLALRSIVRTVVPDVIHTHSPVPASYLRVLARVGGIPVVSTEHNVWERFRRPTRIANAATHAWSAHHFAVSQEVADSVDPAGRDRVEVLHHGIDVEGTRHRVRLRRDVRAELGIDEGTRVVITVANTRPKKDLPTLLRAAKIVSRQHPEVLFLHAGSGPEEQDLHALHRELELGDRFRFLGKRDDAVDLIAAADVFCLSSIHEGLPVTVMEAFAVGTPVVATAVGGLPEAVTDGSEGRLVAPRDPAALAGAIAALVADGSALADHAEAARRAAHRFDAATATERIEEVYRATVAAADQQTRANRR